jgi:hypothetical protein
MKRQARSPQAGPLSADQAAAQYRGVRRALWLSTAASWVVVLVVVVAVSHDRALIAAAAGALALISTAMTAVLLRLVKRNLERRVEPGLAERLDIGL